MRSGSKDEKYSFITIVGVCFFLCAFVFPIPLYAAGEIAAWGINNYGQCNVPEPNTGFVAIAGGGYHSLGLKSDGSIVAWGYNVNGQCNVPSPNTGFTAIAGGYFHSLGLKSDGSIVAWG
ncbi:MAG: hypothetical protein JW947_11095, partial [Sedimentisphaerales bacterium]|nr:hypothetical protein [Sedimentisphaerales bacterium]